LAVNIKAIRSPFGLEILLPVVAFHTAAFVAGYKVTEAVFPDAPDLPALAKTISFETGKLQWAHESLLLTLLPSNLLLPGSFVKQNILLIVSSIGESSIHDTDKDWLNDVIPKLNHINFQRPFVYFAKSVLIAAGMQSSLLGLALANKFFADSNVGLPSAISVSIFTVLFHFH
jgi:hypothetical protein